MAYDIIIIVLGGLSFLVAATSAHQISHREISYVGRLRRPQAQSVSPSAAIDSMGIAQGLRQFILRGNVVDVAVGVVVGSAFASIVSAFTKDLLTPLIAVIVGKPDFSVITFTVHGAVFAFDDFLNALVSFLLVASAVYFFVITPINALMARMRKTPAPSDPTTRRCPECLSEVPIEAQRCAHCAQPLGISHVA